MQDSTFQDMRGSKRQRGPKTEAAKASWKAQERTMATPKKAATEQAAATDDRITVRQTTATQQKLIALRKAKPDLPDAAEMIRRLIDRARAKA